MARDGIQILVTQSLRTTECTEEAAATTDTLSSPLCFQLKRAKVLVLAILDVPSRLKGAKKAKLKI